MKEETKDKPVMMYIHGFMSGSNGTKREQLEEQYGEKYRIVVPELDADPDSSLAKINKIIKEENPEIIIGTSLGGWMTIMTESGERRLVIVNPCMDPFRELSICVDEELEYYCPRLDGVQTYVLRQETLDKYRKYDVEENVRKKASHIQALCSSKDELLATRHIDALKPLLPEEQLTVKDDFEHRCHGAGLQHLFEIIG